VIRIITVEGSNQDRDARSNHNENMEYLLL
jgi:hypothetical protein